LWGWGSTTSGNLGQGTMDSTLAAPTQVGSAKTWASVSAGYEQTLAIKSDGSLWAWGDNFYGSLGLGNYTDKDIPTEITGK
jgi:alpha-tubulin suppressor-like RCC1 family protein